MTPLEKELLETFKNFAIQYEKDNKEQQELIENLDKQQTKRLESLISQQNELINNFSETINSFNNRMNDLSNRITELEKACQDIMNVLEK